VQFEVNQHRTFSHSLAFYFVYARQESTTTRRVLLQLIRALEKAYVISVNSVEDIKNLYKSLGLVRSLLMVQVAPDEEDILKTSIWYDNWLLCRRRRCCC